jgi:hypothetical protein
VFILESSVTFGFGAVSSGISNSGISTRPAAIMGRSSTVGYDWQGILAYPGNQSVSTGDGMGSIAGLWLKAMKKVAESIATCWVIERMR